MKNERFTEVYTQGKLKATQVLRDNETGVLYMFHQLGYSGGLTVMVDQDGKPLVDEEFIKQKKSNQM